MTTRTVAKASLIALALVLASSALSSSDLMASGYIMAGGINGEPICEPGGNQDCPST